MYNSMWQRQPLNSVAESCRNICILIFVRSLIVKSFCKIQAVFLLCLTCLDSRVSKICYVVASTIHDKYILSSNLIFLTYDTFVSAFLNIMFTSINNLCVLAPVTSIIAMMQKLLPENEIRRFLCVF